MTYTASALKELWNKANIDIWSVLLNKTVLTAKDKIKSAEEGSTSAFRDAKPFPGTIMASMMARTTTFIDYQLQISSMIVHVRRFNLGFEKCTWIWSQFFRSTGYAAGLGPNGPAELLAWRESLWASFPFSPPGTTVGLRVQSLWTAAPFTMWA